MTAITVLALSLVLSYIFVEIWGRLHFLKLFSRVKYVCGWFAIFITFFSGAPWWIFYLPAGLIIGSAYSSINKKY